MQAGLMKVKTKTNKFIAQLEFRITQMRITNAYSVAIKAAYSTDVPCELLCSRLPIGLASSPGSTQLFNVAREKRESLGDSHVIRHKF